MPVTAQFLHSERHRSAIVASGLVNEKITSDHSSNQPLLIYFLDVGRTGAFPVPEHGDPISNRENLLDTVRDINDPKILFPQPFEYLEENTGRFVIEHGGWFIQD